MPPSAARHPFRVRPALAIAGFLAAAASPIEAQQAAPVHTEDLEAFRPRVIGPAVTGGRVHDLEALPDDPSTLYVATASGGLWKTTNRGHTWTNVFDTMAVSTFGDVAIAPSNPEVVYAGTGEQNNRQSTSWGNGVYRSDDGGRSWRHLGLENTRHIGKVVIHPGDPDVAWVAALGNLWKGSPDRGVYRTTDGGRTWQKVLEGQNRWTGAVDLVIDPANPDVLYAAMYQRLRRTWGFNGGGPGSGIWKTSDGGDAWRELTDGIPDEDKGRIGLAVARTDPRVLNALIETADEETTGTYRSTDGGESWRRVSAHDPRPMYYSEIFIDPTDEDVVYSLATRSARSDDGGRTWTDISARYTYDVGVHSDHHALWIDPGDPEHFYLAGDAGLHETYDRGVHYRKLNNFPIGQFYAIGVDMRDPYWVYGGMQDNHSWMGPSRTRSWIGIIDDHWKQIGFGDGMYWQVDPTTHRYAYGNSQNGSYTRVDAETGDMLDIRPAEPPDEEYRWDWVSPSLVSDHDPSTVFVGGNRLFVSRDRGVSWERTQDLTTGTDRDTLELMGVPGAEIGISKNDGTSSYAEITTISQSPVDADVLWVGTDDGNVQVSRDGGGTWRNVAGSVPGVERGTYVSRVLASARGTGTAYVTFDAHRDGDFAPYVYRTGDFGASWEALHRGLPSGSVNVLVEDPDAPDVLFLGTEHHLYASADAGASWARVPNLPTTAYDDLVIHPREKDLVIGTHGRSIWILDDIRPLEEWDTASSGAPIHLFSIRPATIFHHWKDTSYRGTDEWHGENPADGAIVTYRVGRGAGSSAVMRVRDGQGRLVREMRVPGGEGVHRVNWDLRHGWPRDTTEVWSPQGTDRLPRSVEQRGPFVTPGAYTVSVEVGRSTAEKEVEVRLDPAMADRITAIQLRDREEFLLEVLAMGRRAESLRRRLESSDREPGDLAEGVNRLQSRLDRLYEGLNGSGVQQGSLFPPTSAHRAQRRRVADELASLEARVEEIPGG